VTEHLFVVRGYLIGALDFLIGYDQEVNWRLGVNIQKSRTSSS
jgi:hypothetical protein